jgi:hypothetical protein
MSRVTIVDAAAFAAALSFATSVLAQQGADAGLVNQVSGAVSYSAPAAEARPVQPFMKVREGDRIAVPAGASVRVLYFQGNRQETWKGPAAFRVGPGQGDAASGKPDVTVLPSAVPVKLARLPELLQSARLGGVTVRGGARKPPPTGEELAQLSQAKGNYGVMRAQAGTDDITPELYMISTLQELGLYEEMTPMLDELSRHEPLPSEVQELVKWFRSRQPAP